MSDDAIKAALDAAALRLARELHAGEEVCAVHVQVASATIVEFLREHAKAHRIRNLVCLANQIEEAARDA